MNKPIEWDIYKRAYKHGFAGVVQKYWKALGPYAIEDSRVATKCSRQGTSSALIYPWAGYRP